MENVRAVLVDADAVAVAVIVAVAADMLFAVDDKYLLTAFGKHTGHSCAGNAGTYNNIIHNAPILFSKDTCVENFISWRTKKGKRKMQMVSLTFEKGLFSLMPT